MTILPGGSLCTNFLQGLFLLWGCYLHLKPASHILPLTRHREGSCLGFLAQINSCIMLPTLLSFLFAAAALDLRTSNALDLRQSVLGQTVSLRCLVSTPVLRWEWKPKFPICAGVGARVIMVMGPRWFSPPLRFKNRLHASINSNNLELQGVLTGDSGTYTCVAENGRQWITNLQVQEGCFNNINLTVIPHGPLEVTLYCKLCNLKRPENSFTWSVNGIPLQQLLGSQRMRRGAILSVSLSNKNLLGAWRCTSMENRAWYSEHCLELASPDYNPEEDLEYSEEKEPEGGPESPSLNLFQLTLTALGALVLFCLVTLCICFFCRQSQERQQKSYESIAEDTKGESQLPSLGPSQRDPSPLSRTPSERDGGGVHYVELEQLPPSRQVPKPPSLVRPSTVYATVV